MNVGKRDHHEIAAARMSPIHYAVYDLNARVRVRVELPRIK